MGDVRAELAQRYCLFFFNCYKKDFILLGLAGGHNPPKADKDKTAAYLPFKS